ERRREALGAVNPLAKEEYEAEKERLEELAAQRADLEDSLAELEKLSKELSDTVEKRFAETFDAVQKHFHEVAGTLFPGGEGRLPTATMGRSVRLRRRSPDRAQSFATTHRRRRMEAADVLYGVTMGGEGVPRTVSRRLRREAAEAVSAAESFKTGRSRATVQG